MTTRRRLGPRMAAVTAGAAAVASAVLLVGFTSPTESAWTAGAVNQTGTAKTGAVSGTYTVAGQTCTAVAASPGVCTTQVVSGNPGRLGASTVSGTLTNTSTGAPNTATQAIQVAACEPLKFDDVVTPSAPLIARGGIGRQVSDKWGSTSAARFTGTDDSATGISRVPMSQLASGSWTMGVWFRAAAGSTGTGLIGAAASVETTPNATYGGSPSLRLRANGDLRLEWINTSNVRDGFSWVNTGARDGRWHLVTISVNRSTGQFSAYLDTTLLGSAAAPAMNPFTGVDLFWHLGWVDVSRSALPADVPFWVGDLSGAFYLPSAITLAQATALYNTTSASGYQSSLQAQAAGSIWMLGDTRSNRFTGALSYVSGGDPCAFAYLGVTSNGTSLVANTAIATLVAQSSGGTSWSGSLAAPAPGASATIVTTFGRQATFDADVASMELQLTYSHRIQLGTTNWSTVMTWTQLNLIA